MKITKRTKRVINRERKMTTKKVNMAQQQQDVEVQSGVDTTRQSSFATDVRDIVKTADAELVAVNTPAVSKPNPNELSGTAKLIWDELKNSNINVYGMTMKLFAVCTPVPISNTELYLRLKNPSALVALEESTQPFMGKDYDNCVCKKYLVELKDKFGVVSLNPKSKQ